jgi:probable selenium-dependent hydroxylase accessory protein YqeC
MRSIRVGELADALDLGPRELVALVGGGGKTTALFALGRQLGGSVILTTTTKMGRDRDGGHRTLFAPSDEELRSALATNSCVLAWHEDAVHKAVGVTPETADHWLDLADHVVVEADGSRRKPFKAPLGYEPVVPSATTVLVACVGASALGAPIETQCQRPERVADIAGCAVTDLLTPTRLAAVLMSDEGSRKGLPDGARFAVLINQVTVAHADYLAELEAALPALVPIVAVAPFLPGESPEDLDE